ncbi:Cadherin-23 [Saguinus oedipus]|uniref:Cadherin-23 n=1 Tax=Saguinus oedipus TaxID=9490 RepID=A0ABQ9U8D7_SAGOE|nr:Cadherin-23 [Saguinus oedipus]
MVLPSAVNEEKNFHLQPDASAGAAGPGPGVSSNHSWTPPHGPSPSLNLVADLMLQEVHVVLQDINDQPPCFTKAEYTAGVATDAKLGSELIWVLALDVEDIGNNSLVFFSILAIHYFQALVNNSEDHGTTESQTHHPYSPMMING